MDQAQAKLRIDLAALAEQMATLSTLPTALTVLSARVETLERQLAVETKTRLDREAAEKAERERIQKEVDDKAAAVKAAAEAKAGKRLFAVKPKPAPEKT